MDYRLTDSIELEARQRPVVLRCRACSALAWSGTMCRRCGGDLDETESDPTGEVIAVTTVARVPDDVVLAPPYTVALVRLVEGAESFGVANAGDELRIGDRVVLDLDEVVRDGEVISYVRLHRAPSLVTGGAP
jgi:uncharacterized OB-fold protein